MNSKNLPNGFIKGVKNIQGDYKQFNYDITSKLLEKYKPRVALRLVKRQEKTIKSRAA